MGTTLDRGPLLSAGWRHAVGRVGALLPTAGIAAYGWSCCLWLELLPGDQLASAAPN